MKSRWWLKFLVLALIIALVPILTASAAESGPTLQPPARERTAPAPAAPTGRVIREAAPENPILNNDDPGSAEEIQCGWTLYGAIDYQGDVDYFYTDFYGGQMLAGIVNAYEWGSFLDPTLTLYQPDGVTEILYDDDFDSLDPLIHHTDLYGGGRYYWKMAGFGGYSTGDYWLTVDHRIYVTASTNGTVQGISYSKGDVLVYHACGGWWDMFLDMSDLGITKGVTDIAVVPSYNAVLMSLPKQTIPNYGQSSPNDVYEVNVWDVGWDTEGSFYQLLDGSDVGLSTGGESIDGLMVTPWGDLAISTKGAGNLPNVGKIADEDIVGFDAGTLGPATSGLWYMQFDTSDEGLNKVDTFGIYMNDYWWDHYFVFDKIITINGYTFGKNSVGTCWPSVLGWDTDCISWWSYFYGVPAGLPAKVKLWGLDMGTTLFPDGYFSLSNAPAVDK